MMFLLPGQKKKNGHPVRRGCEGFTLLEVIVALSIIAIAVVTAIQLYSANLRTISRSDSYVNATVNAEAVMRNVVEAEDFPAGAMTGGVSNGYRFDSLAVRVNEEKTKQSNVELYQVKVTVYWKEGIRDKSLTLNTLKLVEKKI
jgi:general secretion pathway protein I